MQQDHIPLISVPGRPVPYPHVATIGMRIEVAMRTGRTTSSDLASAIGMDQAEFLRLLEDQGSALTPAKIMALASRLNVSQAWLVGGDGPMNSLCMGAFNLQPGQNLVCAFEQAAHWASLPRRP